MAAQLGRAPPRSYVVLNGRAETVAMSYCTKHERVRMQILLDALLTDCRRPIELIGKVDNTQAITAVHKGYSKKLRFLERTASAASGPYTSSLSPARCASSTRRPAHIAETVSPSISRRQVPGGSRYGGSGTEPLTTGWST